MSVLAIVSNTHYIIYTPGGYIGWRQSREEDAWNTVEKRITANYLKRT